MDDKVNGAQSSTPGEGFSGKGIVSIEKDNVRLDFSIVKQSIKADASFRTQTLKFVAWLGASVSGLTVILLVIGYLALGAHDAMVGIPRVVEIESEYVVVGGLFFARSGIFVFGALLLKKSWIVVLLTVLLLSTLHLSKSWSARKRRIALWVSIIAVFVGGLFSLWSLTDPLQFTNILFNNTADTPDVLDWIRRNETVALQKQYGFCTLGFICVATVFVYWLRSLNLGEAHGSSSARMTSWKAVTVSALVLLGVELFLIPRSYGVMTLPVEYPVLTSIEPSTTGISLPLFLLRQDKDLLVLYDPKSQLIINLKASSLERFDVGAPRNVFAEKTNQESGARREQ
jgi:hypothetical protein